MLFRYCHIGGRYGGGKTMVALRLALELAMQGHVRYIASNVPAPYVTPVSGLPAAMPVDTAVVYDEGGVFLRSSKHLESYAAYLRKANIVMLVSSVIPPPRFAIKFTVWRSFNGFALGIPCALYSWRIRVDGDDDVSGRFVYWRPDKFYGHYDTAFVPDQRWPTELEGYISRVVAAGTAFRSDDAAQQEVIRTVEYVAQEVEQSVERIKVLSGQSRRGLRGKKRRWG